MSAEKESITIVVAGKPIPIESDVHASIQSVVSRALELSGNTGQPAQNWELRDADGHDVDLHKKVGDFASGTKLFLNQKVGVGG
ncbi:MAG: DUF2604 domain-containing protein [Terriglobales bacterium]